MATLAARAMNSFDNFLGFQGDDPTNETEYLALEPLHEQTAIYSSGAPTWEQISAKMTELQASDTAKETDADNANQKLLDLGLTQAEVTAITGYEPPAE